MAYPMQFQHGHACNAPVYGVVGKYPQDEGGGGVNCGEPQKYVTAPTFNALCAPWLNWG